MGLVISDIIQRRTMTDTIEGILKEYDDNYPYAQFPMRRAISKINKLVMGAIPKKITKRTCWKTGPWNNCVDEVRERMEKLFE